MAAAAELESVERNLVGVQVPLIAPNAQVAEWQTHYVQTVSFKGSTPFLSTKMPMWRKGRRATLRTLYPEGCGGSSPSIGTSG